MLKNPHHYSKRAGQDVIFSVVKCSTHFVLWSQISSVVVSDRSALESWHPISPKLSNEAQKTCCLLLQFIKTIAIPIVPVNWTVFCQLRFLSNLPWSFLFSHAQGYPIYMPNDNKWKILYTSLKKPHSV